jgi:hypothetical protein
MGSNGKPTDDQRVSPPRANLVKKLVLVAAAIGVVATAFVVLRDGETASDTGPPAASIDTRQGDEQEPSDRHHVLVVRSTGGVSPTTIRECYTFSDSGRVELRRAGDATLVDRGLYYEDGTIEWDSGRVSTFSSAGASWEVDFEAASEVETC